MRKRKQMSRMSSRVSRSPSISACDEPGEDVVGRRRLALVEERGRSSRRSRWPLRVHDRAAVRRRRTSRSGRSSRGAGCRRADRGTCAARSSGRPIRPRNTDDGNSSANSSVKLHSPRSTNASMNSLTRRVMSSSCSSMRLGANSGSRSLRYFECFGRVDVERDQRPHVAERHVDLRREQLVVAQHVVVELAAEHHDDAVHGRRHPALLDHVAVHRLRFGQVQQRVHLHLRVPVDRGDVRLVGLLVGHVGPPEPRRAGDDTDSTAPPQCGGATWTARVSRAVRDPVRSRDATRADARCRSCVRCRPGSDLRSAGPGRGDAGHRADCAPTSRARRPGSRVERLGLHHPFEITEWTTALDQVACDGTRVAQCRRAR